MDKVTKYQDVIVAFLHHYNAESGGNKENAVQRRILIDRENNSFQLLSIGWSGKHYTFGPIFHFDIIDGKIDKSSTNGMTKVRQSTSR
jgi:hypothetical protein